ncbi:CAP domain-containing protein [Psychromonas sp.]|uniref:CAP domain-containing protein n=1 Tax=Psychromonas sp. TaxID=1884585 RepID=UPI0035633049
MRLLIIPTFAVAAAGLLLTACTQGIGYPVENAPITVSSQPAAGQLTESVTASKASPNIEYDPSPTFEQEMLSEVNRIRARGTHCGGKKMPPVAPLTWNNKLQQAAFVHANNMAKKDFFDHRGLDGNGSGQRISDAGYQARAIV